MEDFTLQSIGILIQCGAEIVEYDSDTGAPVRLNGEYARDEAGQAR